MVASRCPQRPCFRAQSISRSISRWVRYRRLTVKFTMLGVRFLDVDFMRINFACGLPTVYLIHICTVGRAAAWSASRSQCRMEAPGRVREPRAHLVLSCRRTSIMNPPVGGTFWFQIFIQASSPEIWCELFLVREVAGAEWGGLFLGYLLSEKTPAALVRLMQPP